MLKNSDSEDSDGEKDTGECEVGRGSNGPRAVLRPPRLVVRMEQELSTILAKQQAEADKLAQMMAAAGNGGMQTDQLELAKLQAATSLDLRKDIASIDKFTGEVGELNHFLRSGEGVTQRISERARTGRLDALDAESLRGALIRRISRHILNQLQVDESTPWAVVKQRLQKEYGGGRWTPEEDALHMLRMVRTAGQTRGEFASRLLVAYQGVVEKFRETLTGPDAAGKLAVIESLAMVQLSEAAGKPLAGGLQEAANALIDAAGRGEEEPGGWTQPRREWAPARRRPEGRDRRVPREPSGRRREESRRTRHAAPPAPRRRPDERRCFACGKTGHLQARCSEAACYQCGGRGHFARACPYRPPVRRSKDEPMEVNAHHADGRTRSRAAKEVPRETEDSQSEDTSSTDSEVAGATYAAVVRKGKSPRRSRGRVGGSSE